VSQRLSQHGKYQWQLRSYLKDQRAWATTSDQY
jgi:hypothetical protein